jgi:hypothetical protein
VVELVHLYPRIAAQSLGRRHAFEARSEPLKLRHTPSPYLLGGQPIQGHLFGQVHRPLGLRLPKAEIKRPTFSCRKK